MDAVVVLRGVSIAVMMLGLGVVVSGAGVAVSGAVEGAESAGLLLGGLIVALAALAERQAGVIVMRRHRRANREMQRQVKEMRRQGVLPRR